MFTRIQKNALLSTAALLLLSLMMIFIAQLYLVKILCMLIIIIFASKNKGFEVCISQYCYFNSIRKLGNWNGNSISKSRSF